MKVQCHRQSTKLTPEIPPLLYMEPEGESDQQTIANLLGQGQLIGRGGN